MANIDTVRTFIGLVDAHHSGDVNALAPYLNEDVVLDNSPGPIVVGREALLREFAAFGRQITGAYYQILAMAEDENGVVLVERLDQFQTDAGTFELPVVGVFRLEDGRIRHWREYNDNSVVEKQLHDLKIAYQMPAA